MDATVITMLLAQKSSVECLVSHVSSTEHAKSYVVAIDR